MKIAILGAESTGKTALSQALVEHARGAQLVATWVPESLRGWCNAHGRTPRRDEQWGIAQSQHQCVAQAPTVDWLVVDTTPLMTAIYSDLLFGDTSLYAMAVAHHAQYDLTLLTGLDLPWVADGLQRDGPHVREPVDARIRQALNQAGLAYSVVYGQGPQRLAAALRAIRATRASSATLCKPSHRT